MQQGLKLDEEVPVKLTDDQLLQRSETLAGKMEYRKTLVASAKEDAEKWKAQIAEVDSEIARLGRVILDAFEMRKQGELRFGDQAAVDRAEATAALARIGRRAEGGNGATSEG
jgi:hypothetical protein